MTTTLALRAVDRVLCLAPHPDDETLAAAGLLQQAVAVGAALRVVFATDGENNPWAQRAVEHRWRVGGADRARWGARRRREALDALAVLGVPDQAAAFLGLPDQGLTPELMRGDGAALAAVAREIERFAPTLLLAPAICDLHPDHSALAVLARFALDHASLRRRRPLLLAYVVHGRRGGHRRSAEGWRVSLTAEQSARKRAAIGRHRSQIFLRRRSMLAFAAGDETYAPSGPGGDEEANPLGRASIEGEALVLHLRHKASWGRLGSPTLYLAVDGRGGGVRLRAGLPDAPGPVAVVDLATETSIASARISGTRRDRELAFPRTLFRDATSMFAKLERWHAGFFDEAGWCRIALPHERRLDQCRPVDAVPAAAGGSTVSASA